MESLMAKVLKRSQEAIREVDLKHILTRWNHEI